MMSIYDDDTFSYQSDEPYRRSIGEGQQIVIRRLDPNIACIGFEMEDGNVPIPIPDGVSVVLSETAIPSARVGDEYFVVTWIGNYHVVRNGEALYEIYNQQSQAIQPAE